MSDLLGIGASGISVYQRALSTVSNNIANLGTDGYARQTTEIKQTDTAGPFHSRYLHDVNNRSTPRL